MIGSRISNAHALRNHVGASAFASKRRRWRLLLLLPVLLLPFALGELVGLARESLLFQQPINPSSLIENVSDAVFEVDCAGNNYGSGWGLKLGADYFVVTNEHVMTECAETGFIRATNSKVGDFYLEMVAMDGRYWLSSSLGDRDLALLAASKKIPTLKFQQAEALMGQWVATFGYPGSAFETDGLSVTQGHISGVDSSGLLLTDAAINSGNSGGPAVNSRGEVVGTVFASDPNDQNDNMGYLQGRAQHCGLVFQCEADRIILQKPFEPIAFVSE